MLLGSKHYVNLNKYHLHCHRASLNWELVWRDAAKIVSNLVCRSPELKRTVLIQPGPLMPHNVLPLHYRTGKRSHQKKKKNKLQLCRRTRAYIIVDRYLLERGRLHFSSRSKESPDENEKKMNWVADLVDRSLKAGEPPKLHQERPLQTSGKQVSTSASVSQTTVGALARTARDPGMPSAANAGTNAGELAMHGAPFSRTTTGATVSQTKTLV